MSERFDVIVNPTSAGGRTSKRLDDLRRAADEALGEYQLLMTQAQGHATELAKESTADVVVSVGGDGTAHEVVNGLMQQPKEGRPTLTVVAAGTGSDLVKTLNMPPDLTRSLEIAASVEHSCAVDIIQACLTSPSGEEVTRYGINVSGFGMNGQVVHRANASSKRLGGAFTFAKATLETILVESPQSADIRWTREDGTVGSFQGRISSVFLANGCHCGGAMVIGQDRTMSDGVLELVIVPELPTWRMITGARHLFDGKLTRIPGVIADRITNLQANSDAVVLLDMDGEQPGMLPARFYVMPKGMLVRAIF